MFRLLSKIIQSLLAFCLISSASTAEDHQPEFALMDWFPFTWNDETTGAKIPAGINVDIINVINEMTGMNAKVNVMALPRAVRIVGDGQADMTITYLDPVAVKNVDFVLQIGCTSNMLAYRNKFSVTNMVDLDGMVIAYPEGGYFDKHFGEISGMTSVHIVHNDKILFAYQRGRIDGFAINTTIWHAYNKGLHPTIKLSAADKASFGSPYIWDNIPLYISVSKSSDHAEKLKTALTSLKGNSEFHSRIRSIYGAYGDPAQGACKN